jgi:putative membrane protein insertion efficiency factor
LKKLISYIFISIIKAYKGMISPLFSPKCRYTPTCSDYGIQSINKHGVLRGGYYTIKRILSCHPWGGDGYDPVP